MKASNFNLLIGININNGDKFNNKVIEKKSFKFLDNFIFLFFFSSNNYYTPTPFIFKFFLNTIIIKKKVNENAFTNRSLSD